MDTPPSNRPPAKTKSTAIALLNLVQPPFQVALHPPLECEPLRCLEMKRSTSYCVLEVGKYPWSKKEG